MQLDVFIVNRSRYTSCYVVKQIKQTQYPFPIKPHLQIFSDNQQYQAKSLLESFRVTNHIVEFGKKVADAVTLLSELPVRFSDLFG